MRTYRIDFGSATAEDMVQVAKELLSLNLNALPDETADTLREQAPYTAQFLVENPPDLQ